MCSVASEPAAMDLSRLAAGETNLKAPVHEVVDLVSDSESEPELTLTLGSVAQDGEDEEAGSLGDGDEEEEWESQSLFEDTLEEMGDEHLLAGVEPEACTLAEATHFRQQLRELGPEKFCQVTIESGAVTAKKLITAFGFRLPAFLEGAPDEAYYTLLGIALTQELSKRIKLSEYNTVDDVVELIKRSSNIIVLTGAGISTSLGIPDFRSKDTGLYSKIEHLGFSDPQELFDIDIFREDPHKFYSIAADILPSTSRFSPTHGFIRLLQDKGKLLTNYSQNIDNIEGAAGIDPAKLIQCHGSFATASCLKCGAKVPGEAIFHEVRARQIPRCKRCAQTLRAAQDPMAMKRKRSKTGSEKKRTRHLDDSDSDDEYDVPEAGLMKPDITFFGEALPDTFSERLTKHDKDLVDLVIVIGTSLRVAPVSEVVGFLPPSVPQVYISRTPVNHVKFDVDMLGDCDIVVAELCRRAGWELKHEMVPEDQKVDVELVEGFESRYVFTARADCNAAEGESIV